MCRSSLWFFGSLTKICDACEMPASNLCVECVANTIESSQRRTIATDRVHVAIEIVERRVRQPSFVEVQRIDLSVEQLLQHFDVVNDPVVSALRDRQDSRLATGMRCLSCASERIRVDLFLNVLGMKFFQRNRADQPEVVSFGRQENRHRTGHDDRVQNRFVAISIDDHDVTGGDGRVPHHFVGRRRSVGDKETMVGIKNSRRIAFGRGDRTGVVEQLPEFFHRIANVGTQHVFTKKLVKHLAHGTLQKCDAAGVAGAMPRVRSVAGVFAAERERTAGPAHRCTRGLHARMCRATNSGVSSNM